MLVLYRCLCGMLYEWPPPVAELVVVGVVYSRTNPEHPVSGPAGAVMHRLAAGELVCAPCALETFQPAPYPRREVNA